MVKNIAFGALPLMALVACRHPQPRHDGRSDACESLKADARHGALFTRPIVRVESMAEEVTRAEPPFSGVVIVRVRDESVDEVSLAHAMTCHAVGKHVESIRRVATRDDPLRPPETGVTAIRTMRDGDDVVITIFARDPMSHRAIFERAKLLERDSDRRYAELLRVPTEPWLAR